jgi:transcriptional regulator with XRE-family HTH domain
MTLHDYLVLTKTTEAAFADKVGISQPHVWRLRRGKSWPSRDLMARIREATNHAVTPDDFLPAAERAA